MKRIGSLLAMALVAAIPAGLQGRNPPPALPLDLNTIEERGAALDGQWVEF